MSGTQLVGSLAELVGYKLGIAVSDDELADAFSRSGCSEYWPNGDEGVLRLRSEEYEHLALAILEHFGDPYASYARTPPVLGTLRSMPEDRRDIAMSVIARCTELLSAQAAVQLPDQPFDGDAVIAVVANEFGHQGIAIAASLLERMQASVLANPWSRLRRMEWSDLAPLRDLFTTESVSATWGEFFDQRFVDYLNSQLQDVASINWRRFEGLVAEYLSRLGMRVELGPGRNDEGVDARAWLPNAASDEPALLIVQCKRESSKTTKTVLKALAADVAWEGATAGLLVTTASWSPGARTTVATRAYPIIEANGNNVRRWLEEMRTPGVGTWMFD